MRVERARSEESEVAKSDARARNVQLQTPSSSTAKAAETANQGAFSKILDATRATENERDEKLTGDSDGDSSVHRQEDGKRESAAKAGRSGGDEKNNSSGENNDERNLTGAPGMTVTSDRTGETNTSNPQARTILHIADVERIVSTVRSETFAGSKQVTIDLKNSVLDGLRIQLTLTEQGNLKAEFLALNEQIKKQLEARRSELQSILKDRSIKLSHLNITVAEPDKKLVEMDWNSESDVK